MTKASETTSNWAILNKWGNAVDGGQTGWQAVPDALVRGQKDLKLSSTEMVVLLNILIHWWKSEELPHPRPSKIAKRMGVSVRTVERTIGSLEDKQLLLRLPPEKKGSDCDYMVRRFDLSGLVEKVNHLAEIYRLAA